METSFHVERTEDRGGLAVVRTPHMEDAGPTPETGQEGYPEPIVSDYGPAHIDRDAALHHELACIPSTLSSIPPTPPPPEGVSPSDIYTPPPPSISFFGWRGDRREDSVRGGRVGRVVGVRGATIGVGWRGGGGYPCFAAGCCRTGDARY